MPGPRSDYRCSRCDKVFEDLPIGTEKCPGCGKSKWLTRVYAANVSTSGISKRKDPQLEAAWNETRKPALSEHQKRAPMFGVPIANIAGAMTHFVKSSFQQAGLPEAQMGGIQAAGGMGGLKAGTSSYKRGEIRRNLPLDGGLVQEMKLRPPKARVAGKDTKAGEEIAKALRK